MYSSANGPGRWVDQESRVAEQLEHLPPHERPRRYSDSPPYRITSLGMPYGPSVCPHCLNDINRSKQENSQIHPTMILNSHTRLEDFKVAVNTALKSRHKEGIYDEAKALLFNWEANDLGLKTPEKGSLLLDETMKLMRVFQDLYHFDANHYLIPSENPHTKVQLELSKIIDELSDKQSKEGKTPLLIVYYNGHGIVQNGKLIWSARKEWQRENSRYPALSWYDLQVMLERAVFDVLLILDCCHAAGAITKGSGGTMEVLAGCSRETKAIAPGGGRVIGSPFTHSLIQYLEKEASNSNGLLVTELQTWLSLDEVLEDQSPVHVVLTGHYKPIKLRPLLSEAEITAKKTLTALPLKSELRAVLAINFRGDLLPDIEEFVQWLNSQRPKEVDGVKVNDVSMSIEASFESCSTLILLSMPLFMWASFQDSTGCSLVGFTKSGNTLLKQHNAPFANHFELGAFLSRRFSQTIYSSQEGGRLGLVEPLYILLERFVEAGAQPSQPKSIPLEPELNTTQGLENVIEAMGLDKDLKSDLKILASEFEGCEITLSVHLINRFLVTFGANPPALKDDYYSKLRIMLSTILWLDEFFPTDSVCDERLVNMAPLAEAQLIYWMCKSEDVRDMIKDFHIYNISKWEKQRNERYIDDIWSYFVRHDDRVIQFAFKLSRWGVVFFLSVAFERLSRRLFESEQDLDFPTY